MKLSEKPGDGPVQGIDLDSLGDGPRIVVVVRDHMSGVLYSIPALRALRRRWPEAKITLLTSSYSAPILEGGCPYLDQVLPLFTFADEPRRFDRVRDLMRKFRTWARLVGRVDLVVHLRGVGGASLAFCASLGRPAQIGYSQGSRLDSLLTVDIGEQDVELGSRERNQIIIERLGVEPDGDHLELWVSDEARVWARGFLASHGHEDGQMLTLVHPGSHWGCNQWLPERWADAINRLQGERGGSVVLTGVARERPLAESIATGIESRVISAVGETSLSHFVALIEASDLVLSVDAAPTQVCQALDVPAVVMMGAGNPAWNGPVADEPMVMLQTWDNDDPRPEICDWASGACNGPNCRSRLEGISVDLVLDSVSEVMSGPLRSRRDSAGSVE